MNDNLHPLGYFITFTTYGTWLHGDSRSSVDRQHRTYSTPFAPPDAVIVQANRRAMKHDAYLLDGPRRTLVLKTIIEVAAHRNWKLWAVHVRTNHVHAVVTADAKPEKVMADFKAWASRRLKETFRDGDRDRWTQHGSTVYLWEVQRLEAAIDYTLNRQGEPMARFDGKQEIT